MTKIAFIVYRNWAYKILNSILKKIDKKNIILITNKEPEFDIKKLKIKKFKIDPNNNILIYKILKNNQVDIVFFYGWSWLISNKIIDNFLCICLHPSKLPLFRGGSPIQNQILRGVYHSAVTVFRMNKKIDRGPIFMQKKLSLKGNIKKIFLNISKIGTKITFRLLSKFNKKTLIFFKQKGKASFYKRRTENDNQKNSNDLKKITFYQLQDYLRSLKHPYPGFKVILENKKIDLIKIRKIKKNLKVTKLKKNRYLKLKDCFAEIIKYKVIKL
jgi:methionyl-tRNA formyltransferase